MQSVDVFLLRVRIGLTMISSPSSSGDLADLVSALDRFLYKNKAPWDIVAGELSEYMQAALKAKDIRHLKVCLDVLPGLEKMPELLVSGVVKGIMERWQAMDNAQEIALEMKVLADGGWFA
jgi:hypothetical protein